MLPRIPFIMGLTLVLFSAKNPACGAPLGVTSGFTAHSFDRCREVREFAGGNPFATLYWTINTTTSSISVAVRAAVNERTWACVGLSRDDLMPASDAICGSVDVSGGGFLTLRDYYIQGARAQCNTLQKTGTCADGVLGGTESDVSPGAFFSVADGVTHFEVLLFPLLLVFFSVSICLKTLLCVLMLTPPKFSRALDTGDPRDLPVCVFPPSNAARVSVCRCSRF
jgi:DOMON domain